ncbi:MAG TPA: hypothetical protein VHB79_24135 [Polyangiaceae bacterium]|nr:hypothetical protein [Polyangiaceae bacterium]
MTLETDIQSRDAQLLAEAAELLLARVERGEDTGVSRAAAEDGAAEAENYARMALEKQKREEDDQAHAKPEEAPEIGLLGLAELALSLLTRALGKNIAEEDAARARVVTLALAAAADAIDTLNAERQAQGMEPLGFDDQMRLIANSRIGFSGTENEYWREKFGETLDALRQPENPDRTDLGYLSPSTSASASTPSSHAR